MATTRTNTWIFAGIVAVSATAVILQYLGNVALSRRTQDLRQQDGRAVAALAKNQPGSRRAPGEAGTLSRVQAPGTARPTADYSLTAAYQRLLLQERGQIAHDYAALFRRLHLSPGQQVALEKLLQEKSVAATYVAARFSGGAYPGVDPNDLGALKALVSAGTGDIDDQIQQVLGADLFGKYESYSATLSYRGQVNDFSGQLLHSASPLRDEQADQLVELLAKARTDVTPLPDTFATQAAAILDPTQAPQLKTFIGALQARQAILAMNRAAAAQAQPGAGKGQPEGARGRSPLTPSPAGLLLNLQP